MFPNTFLSDFKTSTKEDSDFVQFFNPKESEKAFYVESGWKAPKNIEYNLPNNDTLWKLEEGYTLTPESPIVISWGNNNLNSIRDTITNSIASIIKKIVGIIFTTTMSIGE